MNDPVEVVGIPISQLSVSDFINRLLANEVPLTSPVRFVNAYSLTLAARDASYRRVMTGAGINLPDGTPITWYMSLLLRKRVRPVPGPTILRGALAASADRDARHFFVGGTEATLQKLGTAISEEYPGAKISGMYAPPFAPLDSGFVSECVDKVRRSDATIVWVGVGTPKQDLLAAEMSKCLKIPILGVGAAFDFVAGTVPEAPRLLRGSGLEWAYRLGREPKRLARRYLFGNVQFVWDLLRWYRRDLSRVRAR